MSVDISMGMNMSALRLGWAHNLLKLGYGQRKERLECGKGAFIKRRGREKKRREDNRIEILYDIRQVFQSE
jgi:hypothetical protein